MSYLFYIFFALAPSIIWLLFFLCKDRHPESKKMILIIFLLGIVAAIPTAFIEIGILNILQDFVRSHILFSLLSAFIGIAMMEEVAKYLVVRLKVFRDPEFDEPIDILIYMIVSALGFAAAENVLIMSGAETFRLVETAAISVFRFIGATLLHALCSATLGYFLALSLYFMKKWTKLFISGITLVIFLHGIYNLSIINLDGNIRFAIPLSILVGLTIFVHWSFHKLKKLQSVCRIK